MQELESNILEQWYSRISKSSKKTYRYHFRHFLKYFNMTIEEFLDIGEKTFTYDLKVRANAQRTIEAMLNQYYNYLTEEQGKACNTAATAENVIKSFLKFNKITGIDTPSRKTTRKYHRAPMRKKHIKKLVEYAPYIRDKLLILLAFQTGMDISSLLGLNIGDIEINRTLGIGIVWYNRDKVGYEAVSLFGQDTINLFDQYMNWKKQQLHDAELKLADYTALFTGVRKFQAQKRLVKRTAIKMIRDTAVKTGFITYEELEETYHNRFNPFGFHAIRKAFSSVAEAHGMPYSQIEMSMGHAIEYNGAYKEFINEEKIQNYKKVEPYLSISVDQKILEETTQAQKEDIEHLKDRLNKLEDLLKIVLPKNNL